MKPAIRSILVVPVALALVLVAASASADTISYLLTSANLKGFSGPYAQITIDLNSPTTATVTFESLSRSGITFMMGGPRAVDLNVNGPFAVGLVDGVNSLTGLAPSPVRTDASEDQHAGGPFNLTLGTDGRRRSSTEISFVLTATGGNAWNSAAQVLLPNDHGQIAAAQLAPCRPSGNGCAALGHGNRSRGSASDAMLDPSSVPLTAVPIPPAAWLFGSGVLGLIFIARRRIKESAWPAPVRS